MNKEAASLEAVAVWNMEQIDRAIKEDRLVDAERHDTNAFILFKKARKLRGVNNATRSC